MTNENTLAQRIKAIARELANKQGSRGERIDSAVRRLKALAVDVEAGVE